MERMPTFVEVPSKKRSIVLGTPTGCTPIRKRQRAGSPLIARLSFSNKKKAWTPKTKIVLQETVEEGEQTGKKGVDLWDFVSSKLKRSAHSCRSFYNRTQLNKENISSTQTLNKGKRRILQVTKDSDLTDSSTFDNDGDVIEDSSFIGALFMKDVEVQTTLTIPVQSFNLRNEDKSAEPSYIFAKANEHLGYQSSDAANILHEENVKRIQMYGDLGSISSEELSYFIYLLIEQPSVFLDELWRTDYGRNMIINKFITEVENTSSSLAQHPNKYTIEKSSVLFNKDIDDLMNFDFKCILEELVKYQPLLFKTLLSAALPISATGSKNKTEHAVQKICLVYSILMQNRNKDMSLMQRLIATLLESEHVHQKVYDMLQPLGVSLSHPGMLHLVDVFKGHYNTELLRNIKKKKRLRLVGDNVDFKIGVKHERLQKHEHMEHWFASLALFDTPLFHNLPTIRPQGNLQNTPINTFLLNDTEVTRVLLNFSIHIGRIAQSRMKYFKFLNKVLPKYILGDLSNQLTEKTEIIPLECLPYNESSYADCIKIMQYYQDLVDTSHGEAGVDIPQGRIHIGGDQKTRERFSGTKKVVAGSINPSERFDSLGPITFEFFHLKMKFLNTIYQVLYKSDSDDLGTFEAEKVRMNMNSVNPEVKHHFDADKEFFYQFFTAYVLEALCKFFDMDGLDSDPKVHVPENLEELDDEGLNYWFHTTMRKFFESHNFNTLIYGPHQSQMGIDKDVYIISNGSVHLQKISTFADVDDDYVYNYGRNVLELGLLFQELEDTCRLPDRDRLIRVMKYMVVIFRGHSTIAKYNLEILRFLMHQLVTLSEREANECLYSLFVNTKGKIDSHVPADQVMEHNVQTVKGTIKALGSNKINPEVIKKRTIAEPAFRQIARNFSEKTKTLIRSQKRKNPDPSIEIKAMLKDIHKSNPFGVFIPGRKYEKFPNIKYSLLSACKLESLEQWIQKNQIKYSFEIGQ